MIEGLMFIFGFFLTFFILLSNHLLKKNKSLKSEKNHYKNAVGRYLYFAEAIRYKTINEDFSKNELEAMRFWYNNLILLSKSNCDYPSIFEEE